MPIIAVEDIEHVRYQATDLDRMEQFLTDFGLTRAARTDDVLHMRAASGAHAVHITERGDCDKAIGFGLRAHSLDDLHKLAAHAGGRIEPCTEPGGGQRVRVFDPAGFQVDVVYRADAAKAAIGRTAHVRNTGDRRDRLGQTVRQAPGPSQVLRLGHVVLLVPQFGPVYAFYNQVLGLEISDSYHMKDPGETTFAFLHCGLGERYTDHHTVALGSPPGGIDSPRFDHVAFEVVDLDDLMAGNAWLRDRGWKHSWGVGRHILGSQLFDYWRDPFGNKIEHWTDGDLVNDHYQPSHGPISPDTLAQWAPPLTPEFFE